MSEPLSREATRTYHELLLGHHLASTRALVTGDPALLNCRHLRPHFVDGVIYEQVLGVTRLLNQGVIAAADHLARDATLRRKIGIPEYMDPLLEIDREGGLPSVMARFDGFLDRNGLFQVIEYNSTPAFDDSEAADRAFEGSPIADELAQRYAFRTMHLFDLVAEALRIDQEQHGRGGWPVVAIPVATTTARHELPGWLDHVERRGCTIVVAPFEDFRHEDGRLVVGATDPVAIDTIMPKWSDLLTRVGSPSPIFDAIRARSVRTVNGVSRGLLCGYKHTFELLSNPEYAALFEPAVAAALAKHVPWTRAVRMGKTSYGAKVVDLLPFIADNRERMVLKPSGGNQGAGVLLGTRCTDAQWRQTLKRALQQKYVVQERVSGSVESYPARSGDGLALEESTPTIEPFVWNGDRPSGAIARLSAKGMHTIPEGCSIPALWIIDDAK